MSEAGTTHSSLSAMQLTRRRFWRNRGAPTGCLALSLIALFCFVGPLFVNHTYDQVLPSYVSVPPRLAPYPSEAMLQHAFASIAEQARLEIQTTQVRGDRFTAVLKGDTAIDPRTVRYFDRADAFRDTTIVSSDSNDTIVTFSGHVERDFLPFGADANGRDLLVRIMYGGQVSLLVGTLASTVALGIGVTYGAIAGYFGGRIDNILMRLVELLYSLPFVFLVIVLVVFFGRHFTLIFVVIGAVEWLDMARIVRGQTLTLKRREFIRAAEMLGLSNWQTIRRHVIPNTIGPVVTFLTVIIPRVILLESFLSFLGLGVQAPLTSWGTLIAEGSANMQSSPWLLLFPAAIFIATLFSLNVVGDAVRDAFDPKDA